MSENTQSKKATKEEIFACLAELWDKNPDRRLGELICMVIADPRGRIKLYDISNENLLKDMKHMLSVQNSTEKPNAT